MQSPKQHFERLGAQTDVAAKSTQSNEGQMFRATTRLRWKRWVFAIVALFVCLWLFAKAPADLLAQHAPKERPIVLPATVPSGAGINLRQLVNDRRRNDGVQLLGVAGLTAVCEVEGAVYSLVLGDGVGDWRLTGLSARTAIFERFGEKRVLRLPEMETKMSGRGRSTGAFGDSGTDQERARR